MTSQKILVGGFWFAAMLFAAKSEAAEPQPMKHRVTGLFSPDRQDDLRAVVEKMPNLKIVAIDYPTAEVTFAYDPAKLFDKAKPEEVVTRFDQLLRSASSSTFGVKPLSTLPKEKRSTVEIAVVGLDCKGCALAAYEAISNLEGVLQATVSFKQGRVTASIDPAKTDRPALEAALKQKGVKVVTRK